MEAYERYGPALIRKCQRLLQNHQDAEDIVQGLFLDLLQREEQCYDLPYLYRAATNRCLNHLHSSENRQRLLKEHDVMLRGPVRTLCDEKVIRLSLLVRLVEKLDPACCEVLIYHFFDDLSIEEISELIRVSRKTVGKRLERVKTAARVLLARVQEESS